MPTDSLQGPLTFDDLQAIWEGAVDAEYARPLLEAGQGGGFEVYGQAFEQAARASQAIDYTFQQVYIQPWSGQSGEPASGPGVATVELTFMRGGYLGRPLVLQAGLIDVDEVQNDHSSAGSVPTNTGRQYVLQENVVFAPGDQGPVVALAQAAKPGFGFNNPLPGSISFVENAGTGLYNELGTLVLNPGTALGTPPQPPLSYTLTAFNETDMFVPQNVGQYLLFTSGANLGKTALVLRFVSPGAGTGTGVVLAPLLSFESFDVTAPLVVGGATVQFLDGATLVATGTLLGSSPAASGGGTKFVVQVLQGDPTTATQMTQPSSGTPGECTIDVALASPLLTPEAPSGVPLAGGSSWEILDWSKDWLITVTNEESPQGGALGLLDLIGKERCLTRQFGQTDDQYRDIVWNVADVVTPNAIKRALYAALGTIPWCYRETSNGLLPGIFYDRGLDPASGKLWGGDPEGDFYDDDMLLWGGTIASGAFTVGDPIVYQRQVPAGTGPWLTQALGTFGGFIGALVTTVATASNGKALPQPTIYCASTARFPVAGTVSIAAQTIAYTGIQSNPPAFLGCTGGTGALTTGEAITGPSSTPGASDGTMQFIRKTGEAFEPVSGDRILDRRTGAVFTPTTSVPNDWATIRRWHVYLSYQDMRAYFVVQVQPVSSGEFGFAYDLHPFGAYDASPFDDFYDGFPAGAPKVYGALYAQLSAIVAGGVGFDLFLTDGPCV